MGNYNNFSMFGSRQSQFAIQGKYADANCGTGMMPPSYGYSGNGATGVPAFVTDMMKDFKQAFGDMGGVFGGEQGYAQTPINYAGSISTPYAPLDATILPAYKGSALSPNMGGYDLPTSYSNLPTFTSPTYSSNNPLIDFYVSQSDGKSDPYRSYNPNNPYSTNPADYAIS
jgi:hypothetical protein